MKVCNLYGAGFYYMPGTDMCIKWGGYVRFETVYPANGNISTGTFNAGANNRFSNNVDWRERAFFSADAREQTAYGVARAYFQAGVIQDDTAYGAATDFHATRAFIQWAGFTMGRAVSFFDDVNHASFDYSTGFWPNNDTGDAGQMVFGYTAELGGGVSASVAAELRRDSLILDTNSGSLSASAYGGWQVPDLVANIRVDQAWGFAQVEAAAHEDNATYYDNSNSTAGVLSGYPSDVWGYAIGGGIQINTPMIAPGDHIAANVNYTVGATKYANNTPINNFADVNGGTMGFGLQADCVYGGTVAGGTATSCHQTSAWQAFVGYEHYWTPQWHQSLFGSYEHLSYDSTANGLLCTVETGAATGCNNDWSTWGIGSRLQWDITKNFFMGVEVLYRQLDSATLSSPYTAAVGGLDPSGCTTPGICTIKDQSAWSFHFRTQYSFLP